MKYKPLKQIWKHARIDGRTLKRLNYFDDNVSPLKLTIARKRINEFLGRNEFQIKKCKNIKKCGLTM